MNLTLIYRGPLESCNYACGYCPFALSRATTAEHKADCRALERLVDWVEARHNDQISLFFTPWGEALIHPRYQQAFVRLSNLPHVRKVAIQTNLACRLEWVEACSKPHIALWSTFHPAEITRADFLAKCLELDRRGVRFSVGVVGMKEHTEEISALRRELPPHIYLWVNAYKRKLHYYSAAELRLFTAIDPLFPINNRRHRSLGKSCRCGHQVIAVDGAGTMQRCHFIKEPIGNIYEPGFVQALYERPCTNATCSCHIGYVHLDDLGLYGVFGDGVLERIPARRVW
jgi:MoaA/NifB/PqqE/SkfB family radical SAM enzyme